MTGQLTPSTSGTTNPEPDGADEDVPAETTPSDVKQAVQELLKYGTVDGSAKPRIYGTVLANRDRVLTVLEPLDLSIRIDDVRGLVVLLVSPELTVAGRDQGVDEWAHPLVRRHRLRMDQSLLVAILRRHYVEHERTVADGAAPTVAFDDLLSELQPFLGARGSELEETNRLRRLLEGLKDHGVVSDIVDEEITIRPLICHLADPTSLETLLAHYRRLAAEQRGESTDATSGQPDGESSHRLDDPATGVATGEVRS